MSLVSVNLCPSYLEQYRATVGHSEILLCVMVPPALSPCFQSSACVSVLEQSAPLSTLGGLSMNQHTFACIEEQGHAGEGWWGVDEDEEVHWLSEVLLPAPSAAVMNMNGSIVICWIQFHYICRIKLLFLCAQREKGSWKKQHAAGHAPSLISPN